MLIEFQNCSLNIKFIGDEQEAHLRDWCFGRIRNNLPPSRKNPAKSNSPNKDYLKKNVSTSIRYCKSCKEQTLFTYRKGDKHSKCTVCGETRSSRGDLNKRINKCLFPWRYTK